MKARCARKIFLLMFIAGLCLASAPASVWASGSDYIHRTKDLIVTVDSRWAGGQYGGYTPIRIRVRNTGKKQDLLFRFTAAGEPRGTRVQRSITVGQNETRELTLSVPLTGSIGNYSYAGGRLDVFVNGRVANSLSDSLNLPEAASGIVNCPSLLVISPEKKIDCEQFSLAANSVFMKQATRLGYSSYGHSYSEDTEVIDAALLPDEALDYSGLDILAISLADLKTVSPSQRSGLLDWVQTGGKLIVFETGRPAQDHPDLPGVLGLPAQADWRSAPERSVRGISVFTEEQLNEMRYNGSVSRAVEELAGDVEKLNQNERVKYLWPESSDAFSTHQLMLGYVIAFPDNPFPGTPHDWGWMFKAVNTQDWRWTDRYGMSIRTPDDESVLFAIPGVGGVPKVAFIVLITAFTVVIGPLNYFFLKRRRQLYLLVVTIPAIAFLTSCALFAYAAFSDGFGVTSRTRSLMVLDQRTKTAVTLSRSALYAGVAPTSGLKFTSETAVFPIWSAGQDPPVGTLDWSGGQHFTAGWIRSRTPMQFLTVGHRTERGRLEVTPGAGATIKVANGFAWNMKALAVIDEEGRTYFGDNVPAGGSAQIAAMAPADLLKTLRKIETDHPFDIFPGAVTSPGAVTGGTSARPLIPEVEESTHYNFSDGSLESNISRLLKPKNVNELQERHRTYIAVFSENPGIEMGVEYTDAEGDFHMLWGRY